MGVVHGLEGEAGVIAIEVAVLYKVFDSIDNLNPASVYFRSYSMIAYLLEQVSLLQSGFKHCGSLSATRAIDDCTQKIHTLSEKLCISWLRR